MTKKAKKRSFKKAQCTKRPKKAIHVFKAPTSSEIHTDTNDTQKKSSESKIQIDSCQIPSEIDATPVPSEPEEPQILEPNLKKALHQTTKAERIRHLLSLDVRSVIHRLDAQLPAMIELFSRHRDRETLLSPLRAWVLTANFDHLAELEPEEQQALGGFLEELEALRWYCRYTNDMPHTAQSKLLHFSEQLDAAAQKLLREVESRMILAPKQRAKRREKTSKLDQ